jgi:hypothetical protein
MVTVVGSKIKTRDKQNTGIKTDCVEVRKLG